ncbi:hypothetical protein ACX3U9_00090 [Corynebacterium pyruviciproducens]|uniref:hypothetical protein n=1 Tax=Corynebacterium pyruviciproducens TaxID=598660 RepID=UPI00254ABA14|nr:hypothetical protein [Corynebacterium pyruviciproducens]MDK7215451.1 hypothetical protein [Corynebacterium pyruviciproducens]
MTVEMFLSFVAFLLVIHVCLMRATVPEWIPAPVLVVIAGTLLAAILQYRKDKERWGEIG